jgi:hypothetical protein
MAAIMIVDGSAVGYANQYSHTLTAQGMEVQAISGTLWSLSVLLRTHRRTRHRLVRFTRKKADRHSRRLA